MPQPANYLQGNAYQHSPHPLVNSQPKPCNLEVGHVVYCRTLFYPPHSTGWMDKSNFYFENMCGTMGHLLFPALGP